MKTCVFNNILHDDEKIVFESGVNKKAFFIKNTLLTFIYALLFLMFFLFIISQICVGEFKNDEVANISYITVCVFFGFIVLLISSNWILAANNTYFAITDTRIIKRTGAFNIRYRHYSLKNIGNVTLTQGVFDSKGADASATLTIIAKDFQSDTESEIIIPSLNKGFSAYKILTDKIKGNNEVIRIKNEN